jgi:hypothetical protein
VKRLGAGEGLARELALKIWAFSHGMAGLIASGAVSAMEAGRLSRGAVDALLKDAGLAMPAAGKR